MNHVSHRKSFWKITFATVGGGGGGFVFMIYVFILENVFGKTYSVSSAKAAAVSAVAAITPEVSAVTV